MDIAVLGPLAVDGASPALSPRDRVVLQALATRPGDALGGDLLADALWGDAPPQTWPKIVQGCVVRLRKHLGADVIETLPEGYRLRCHADDLDHVRFERLIDQAREHLVQGSPERTAYLTVRALALWRGRPLADLEEWTPGRVEAQRLEELHLEAEDLQTEAALRTGHHQRILAAARTRVSAAPLREHRWALLALALYQSGRQGDALSALAQARNFLAHELGLDPGAELLHLETAILRQDPELAAPVALDEASVECPYLGLVPYDVDDAEVFFGRDADVAACLKRMDSAGVLAVVGPSGCGKSSLVRAGVAAALRRDGRQVVVLTPGRRPMEALVAVRSARAIVVVDQCEEALSPHGVAARQTEFVAALVERSRQGGLVIALRADRLGTLSAHPPLARLVERGLYLLDAMTGPELRSAIEGPALRAGLRVEPGLVDLLVREVHGEPGALPLLSHVLRQTWERREGGTLTTAGYRDSGGVREAVAQSAEGLYQRLPLDQRQLLRDLLLRLVSPNPQGDPVRCRVPWRQIEADEQHERLIEQLVSARLISSDDDAVEIAHEALARAWPRLRSWLDDDVEGQRILRHLTVAADSWEVMGRPDSELYRGVRVAQAAEWRLRVAPDLTQTEKQFLDACEHADERERHTAERRVLQEQRSNRRLRSLLVAVALLLVASLLAGGAALRSADRAETQALAADARRVGAQALTSPELDTSLLLAAAGAALDPSQDRMASLLSALSRAPALVGSTRAGRIAGISVNPVDGRVGVARLDGVTFYDGRTLREVGRRDGHGSVLATSPDGQLVAAARTPDAAQSASLVDQPVVLLDADGAAPPVQLGGVDAKAGVFEGIGFSPGGRWLAAVLYPGPGKGGPTVVVWDVKKPGAPAAVVDAGLVWTVAVSADGTTLYGDVEGLLRVFDLPSGKLRRTLGSAAGDRAEFTQPLLMSPDGRTLARAVGSEVVILDAGSLTTQARMAGHGRIAQLAFSPDGGRLGVVDDDLAVWDLEGGKPTEVFRGERWGGDQLAFSPDGQTLFTGGLDAPLYSWDLAGTRRFLSVVPVQSRTDHGGMVRISPDGARIAYLGDEGNLEVRDVVSGRLNPTFATDEDQGQFRELAWRPDGQALTSVRGGSLIHAWNPQVGQAMGEWSAAPERVSVAEYSKNSRHLLLGTDHGSLQVLDARTLIPEGAATKVSTQAVLAIDTSPDHHTALVSGDHDAWLVNYVTGRRGRAAPTNGRFSPDGTLIAVPAANGGMGLMRASNLQPVTEPIAAEPYGGNPVFSPDGRFLVGTGHGKVGLWDGPSGDFLGAVAEPDGEVATGFTQDGSRLVLARVDGTVRTWDLRPGSWIAAACRMAGRQLTREQWRESLPGHPYRNPCQARTQ